MPKQTFFNLNKDKQKRIIDSSVSEFSTKVYEQVNLSDIIKKSNIPRGSFYQYFEDKKDLYLYIIEIIKATKMKYLDKTYHQDEIPFLDLVEKLYDQGIRFAIEHPDYVHIFELLLNSKNEIYNQLMKDNLVYASKYYADLINRDKVKGLIRKDIDTDTLANIMVQLTSNVTISDFDSSNKNKAYRTMKKNIHNLLDIFKKGINCNE